MVRDAPSALLTMRRQAQIRDIVSHLIAVNTPRPHSHTCPQIVLFVMANTAVLDERTRLRVKLFGNFIRGFQP